MTTLSIHSRLVQHGTVSAANTPPNSVGRAAPRSAAAAPAVATCPSTPRHGRGRPDLGLLDRRARGRRPGRTSACRGAVALRLDHRCVELVHRAHAG
eukprot:scaffold54273_cov59-Phaeocystis_antarctica.AAC.3